uniref:Uncharacterized protein n=1 Tax=Mustela putorius furo TaxID=9669 RepID=M3YHV1_MUSPF
GCKTKTISTGTPGSPEDPTLCLPLLCILSKPRALPQTCRLERLREQPKTAGRRRASAPIAAPPQNPCSPGTALASPPNATPKGLNLSPSARLPNNLREIPNLEASPPQPPVRNSPGSRGRTGPSAGAALAALLPALARETSPPRAQTPEKLDPNSQPAPPEPPREPREAGPGTAARSGVDSSRGGRRGEEGAPRKETTPPPSWSRNFSQLGREAKRNGYGCERELRDSLEDAVSYQSSP